MEKLIANYRVIIEKENYENGEIVYVANAPTLGISDYGETIDEALKSIEKAIKFHLECLINENKAIPCPDETNQIFVTNTKVEFFPKRKFTFA